MGETKGGLSIIAEALKQYEEIQNSAKEELVAVISNKLAEISSRIADVETRLAAIEKKIAQTAVQQEVKDFSVSAPATAPAAAAAADEDTAGNIAEETAGNAEEEMNGDPQEVEVFSEAEEDRYDFDGKYEEPELEDFEEEEIEEENEEGSVGGEKEENEEENEDENEDENYGDTDNATDEAEDSGVKEVRDWYDWEVDYPAEYVSDLVKSMGINDKMQFVSELFNGRKFEFDMVMSEINSMKSFKDIVNYFRDEYPQWDEASDTIYKFYMHIRRKFRN